MRYFFSAVVVFLFLNFSYALLPHEQNVPQIKINYPEPINAPEDAFSDFFQKPQKIISAKIDPISHNFTLLVCSPLPTGVSAHTEGEARRAAVEFAKKYGPLFPVSLENMRISRVENILGKWYVSLQQCVDDIDVLSASAELRINSDGEIFLFRSTQKPIANNIDTNPTISINEAYHSVLQYVGASKGEMLESHLNIAPIHKKDHYEGKLIWSLEVRTRNPLGLWIAWIDAHTGEIVRILDEMPTVTGTVIG
ncbi:hypothetical protein J7M00_00280, partial [bacterium]|nr:hypothetical protein [bacterium]